MEGYKVEIKEASKELAPYELVKCMDTTLAVQLATACSEEDILIPYAYHVILSVHNEHTNKNKDYEKVLIFDEGGTSYVTGSQSFLSSLQEILASLKKFNYEGPITLKVGMKVSKNYEGKKFLTCSLV